MPGWHKTKFDEEGPWYYPGGHYNAIPDRVVTNHGPVLGYGVVGAYPQHTMNVRTRCVRPLFIEPVGYFIDKEGNPVTPIGLSPIVSVNPYGERYYTTNAWKLATGVKKEDLVEELQGMMPAPWTLVKADVQGRPMKYEPLLANGKEIVPAYSIGFSGISRGLTDTLSEPIAVVVSHEEIVVVWFAYSQGWEECAPRKYLHSGSTRDWWPSCFMIRRYDRDLKLLHESREPITASATPLHGSRERESRVRPTPDGGIVVFVNTAHNPDEMEEKYLELKDSLPPGTSVLTLRTRTAEALEAEHRKWSICYVGPDGEKVRSWGIKEGDKVGHVSSLEVNKQGKAIAVRFGAEQDSPGIFYYVKSLYIGEANDPQSFQRVETDYKEPIEAINSFPNIPPDEAVGGTTSYAIYIDDDGNFYLVTVLDHAEREKGYLLQQQIWKFDPEGKLLMKINRLDDQIRYDQIKDVGHIDRDGYIVATVDNAVKGNEKSWEDWAADREGLYITKYSASAQTPVVEIDPNGKVTRGFLWRFSNTYRPRVSTTGDNLPEEPDKPQLNYIFMGGQEWGYGIYSHTNSSPSYAVDLNFVGINKRMQVFEFPGHPAVFQLPEHLRRRPETDPRKEILYGKGKNQAWPPPPPEEEES
jgi:hypothetical protein